MRFAINKLVLIGALSFLVISCGDDYVTPLAYIPRRQAFDDGRELFFSKPDREVLWLDWAPDGRRFVYSSVINGVVYKVNVYNTVTGEDKEISTGDGGRVQWSPRGGYVLLDEPNYDFSIIRPDGTGRRRVIDGTPQTNDFDATWSADGREVVWDAFRSADKTSRNVYCVDIDGGDIKRVTYDDHADEEYPICSPGGEWIAFFKLDEVWDWDPSHRTPVNLITPEGSNYHMLFQGNDADNGHVMWLNDWSADGRYVLMTVCSSNAQGEWFDLWCFDVKNRKFIQVTSSPGPVNTYADYDGVFGPDGKIYFLVTTVGAVSAGIWRVDPHLP